MAMSDCWSPGTASRLRRWFLRVASRNPFYSWGIGIYARYVHRKYEEWLYRQPRRVDIGGKTSVILVARKPVEEGAFRIRALLCLNSMVASFDEVILIDWNSPGRGLAAELEDGLSRTGRLRCIRIKADEARRFTRGDPMAQACCESIGRNIAIRRATGAWIVSTNIDIVAPKRELLGWLPWDENTFVVVARRDLRMREFDWMDPKHHMSTIQERAALSALRVDPAPDWERDPWSMVAACGDFQVASRSVWCRIRGFEEGMIYRAHTDTNVQKKCMLAGFKVGVHRDVPAIHLKHEIRQGAGVKYNDFQRYVRDFQRTENGEEWGFPSCAFEERCI